MKERGYILANGANVNDVYPTDGNGVIDFGNNGDTVISNKTFKYGLLQEEVLPIRKTVISKSVTVTNTNYENLEIGVSYTPEDGFKLVVGDRQIVNSLDYSDNLNFFLYSKTAPESDDSVTDNGTTYYRVGQCTVKHRDENIIVKNHEESYKNNYIFDSATSSFKPVENENLSIDIINDVYIGNEYNIIDGHVYKNDPTNTTKYVTFSEDWRENVDITAANATVDNDKGTVSPLITENTFRQITSISVTAE